VYVAKHGTAKGLAEVLAKHFKGADVEVQALPDGPGNLLLIRAAPAAFAEVVQLLGKLDERPRLVSVQVLIAEVKPGMAGGQEELDERELQGSMDQVQARVNALVKAGRIGAVKRLQLTAVEGQPSHTLLGDNKPFVAGVHTAATGLISRAVTYRNTGFSVKVTPRVSSDKSIHLDLNLQDSRPHVPEDGIQIGTDEKGPVRATEFISSTLDSKLTLTPGKALVARGVKTTSKSGREQTLVIVSADVVDPAASAGNPPANNPPGQIRRPTKRGSPPPP
jgi:type II secretory pathway component GspD/PulD (secretin)